VRATILAAGGLACAGAAMTIAAFAGGGQAAPQPAGAGDRGAEVFAMQGCGGCHTFKPANATGGFGPDLELSLDGKDRSYVMRAIVRPDADISPGYSSGMMPAGFARRIAPRDLELLVTYLMKG
jgi:mono/diheme cytochrome c family protein